VLVLAAGKTEDQGEKTSQRFKKLNEVAHRYPIGLKE